MQDTVRTRLARSATVVAIERARYTLPVTHAMRIAAAHSLGEWVRDVLDRAVAPAKTQMQQALLRGVEG